MFPLSVSCRCRRYTGSHCGAIPARRAFDGMPDDVRLALQMAPRGCRPPLPSGPPVPSPFPPPPLLSLLLARPRRAPPRRRCAGLGFSSRRRWAGGVGVVGAPLPPAGAVGPARHSPPPLAPPLPPRGALPPPPPSAPSPPAPPLPRAGLSPPLPWVALPLFPRAPPPRWGFDLVKRSPVNWARRPKCPSRARASSGRRARGVRLRGGRSRRSRRSPSACPPPVLCIDERRFGGKPSIRLTRASASISTPSACAVAATSRMQPASRARQTPSSTTPPSGEPRSVVVSAIGASIASFRQRTSASLFPIETSRPRSSSSPRSSSRGRGRGARRRTGSVVGCRPARPVPTRSRSTPSARRRDRSGRRSSSTWSRPGRAAARRRCRPPRGRAERVGELRRLRRTQRTSIGRSSLAAAGTSASSRRAARSRHGRHRRSAQATPHASAAERRGRRVRARRRRRRRRHPRRARRVEARRDANRCPRGLRRPGGEVPGRRGRGSARHDCVDREPGRIARRCADRERVRTREKVGSARTASAGR